MSKSFLLLPLILFNCSGCESPAPSEAGPSPSVASPVSAPTLLNLPEQRDALRRQTEVIESAHVYESPLIPARTGSSVLCTTHKISVHMPDNPAEWMVVGELCRPSLKHDKVEVLIHGATYSRSYWNNHVIRATKRGHATFAYDRLGNGLSSKPPGELINVDASAYVNDQVVSALQDGSVASYENVILVGHSFGSLIAVASASGGTGDAVVLTGFAHQATQQANEATQGSVYPAYFDTKFEDFSDPNYFTTIPGTRELLFFSDKVSSSTLEQDELNKDLFQLGLILDIDRHLSTESLGIQAPVMMVLGTEDFMYCGEYINCANPSSYQDYEEMFFSLPLTTKMVNGAGHALALHQGASASSNAIVKWIDDSVLPTP